MGSTPSVLVTGSSSGLGRQIVETLARRGATVFASMRGIDGKNAQAAAELRDLAAREGLALEPIELDVTDEASIERAVATVIERAGRIDVLINNAAGGLVGLTEACTLEQIEWLFQTNVFGALRVNQAVLPHLRRQGSGLVIYTTSTSSQLLVPFMGAYSATKAALESLALSMHYEAASSGVETVLLQLGGYATNFGTNIQVAANDAVTADYGSVGQIAQGFAGGMAATLANCDDPAQVAVRVAELIEQPAGTRPLKVVMGSMTESVNEFAQHHLALQHGYVEALGLGMLLRKPEEVPA